MAFGISFSGIRVEVAGNSKCCVISHTKRHRGPEPEVSDERTAPDPAITLVFADAPLEGSAAEGLSGARWDTARRAAPAVCWPPPPA